MNKRLENVLINALHVIAVLVSLYATLGATVYDVSWGRKPLVTYCILFGAVLLPIIVMDVIAWYTIKRKSDASIFFSDIVQIVVSLAVTIAISVMSRDIADIKFAAVWVVILLVGIFNVILRKKKGK